jgi:hypothetical protein
MIKIIFKNSVSISKKQLVSIIKANWLMMFREIIGVYFENSKKHVVKNTQLLIIKGGGTYSNYRALKR